MELRLQKHWVWVEEHLSNSRGSYNLGSELFDIGGLVSESTSKGQQSRFGGDCQQLGFPSFSKGQGKGGQDYSFEIYGDGFWVMVPCMM